jgi:hypothetical protein
MKRRLGQVRVSFTPALWSKWHSRDVVDSQTLRLREGIQTFRSLLAGRELLAEWERRR